MGETTATTSKPGIRQRVRTVLLVLAYTLAFFTGLVQILTLIAGTWITHDNDGTPRLALSSISTVQFKGVIPSPSKPDTYLVTMHAFLSSFGYEHPAASKAAIISTRPDLPRGFVAIGESLSLPSSSWACLRNGPEQCTSPFYAAFRYSGHETPAALSHFSVIYALTVVLLLLASELLVVVRPSWLRCRCGLSCLKSVCPCPRGTRAEIEALPPTFWDRFRLWTWPVLVPVVFLPAFALALEGMMLKDYVTRRGAGDTEARFGAGWVAMQAASLGAAFVAVVCVYVRKLLGPKASWMEQQDAVAEEGVAQEEGRKEYSDAEPDATLSPVSGAREAA